MAPKFQKLKKQVVVLKTGNTPLVLARESICDGPGRQRAAACLFLDLQQQQRMLKIWMLWLPIADMMAALSIGVQLELCLNQSDITTWSNKFW
jgi:hypothetical protein